MSADLEKRESSWDSPLAEQHAAEVPILAEVNLYKILKYS